MCRTELLVSTTLVWQKPNMNRSSAAQGCSTLSRQSNRTSGKQTRLTAASAPKPIPVLEDGLMISVQGWPLKVTARRCCTSSSAQVQRPISKHCQPCTQSNDQISSAEKRSALEQKLRGVNREGQAAPNPMDVTINPALQVESQVHRGSKLSPYPQRSSLARRKTQLAQQTRRAPLY